MFQTRLKELRENSGYKSQQAFADAFGVAQSTVGNWEAGTREPNAETISKLALFFGVPIGYILGNDSEDSYSAAFRYNLKLKLEELDCDSFAAEPEAMGDFRRLQSLSEKAYPLSLEEACSAVNLLGADVSLDEMVGWKEPKPKQKKPLGKDESIPRGKDEQEIIQLTRKLHPQQQAFLLAWLKTAIELNRETAPAVQGSAVGTGRESALQD